MNVEPEQHAKLSASGAHRWSRCAGAPRMEAGRPRTSNIEAATGIVAHRIVAHRIAPPGLNGAIIADRLGTVIAADGFDITVDQEMIDKVQSYVDYVRALVGDDGMLWVEQRVDFSTWVPDGFGTADAIVYQPKHRRLIVVDLKYGRGTRVNAWANPQGLLYAGGAWSALNELVEIEQIKIVIHQPRLDHVDEWELYPDELFGRLADLSVAANAAVLPDAPLTPGEAQCQYCSARADCKALAEFAMQQAIEDFNLDDSVGNTDIKNPASLDRHDIARILDHTKLVNLFLKAVNERALTTLLVCGKIPGYTLGEGRGSRQWADEQKAVAFLKRQGLKAADIYKKTVLSPAQAEETVPKDRVAKYIERIPGKKTIVKEGDPKALPTAADDFKDHITSPTETKETS